MLSYKNIAHTSAEKENDGYTIYHNNGDDDDIIITVRRNPSSLSEK